MLPCAITCVSVLSSYGLPAYTIAAYSSVVSMFTTEYYKPTILYSATGYSHCYVCIA